MVVAICVSFHVKNWIKAATWGPGKNGKRSQLGLKTCISCLAYTELVLFQALFQQFSISDPAVIQHKSSRFRAVFRPFSSIFSALSRLFPGTYPIVAYLKWCFSICCFAGCPEGQAGPHLPLGHEAVRLTCMGSYENPRDQVVLKNASCAFWQ